MCFLTSVFSHLCLTVNCWMLVFSITVLYQNSQLSKWEFNSEGVRSKLHSDVHEISLVVTLQNMALLSLYNLRFSTNHCA